MLPAQLEVGHLTKMTLMRRTERARMAQARNACPGAGVVPMYLHPSNFADNPNKEMQSITRGGGGGGGGTEQQPPATVRRAPRRLSQSLCREAQRESERLVAAK